MLAVNITRQRLRQDALCVSIAVPLRSKAHWIQSSKRRIYYPLQPVHDALHAPSIISQLGGQHCQRIMSSVTSTLRRRTSYMLEVAISSLASYAPCTDLGH